MPDDSGNKQWEHVSPSQLKTYGRCARKWWWEKIRGHRQPDTPATLRGKRVHQQIEDARRDGTPPADPVALAILEHVGSERVPADRLEWDFKILVPRWAVPLKGVVDSVEPELNRITDYKTTSNFKYARTPEELLNDPQALCYGRAGVLHRGFKAEGLRFRHVYGRTRGAVRTLERECTFTAAQLDRGMDELGEKTHVMAKLALLVDAAIIPDNTDACDDYRGCPHRGRCAVVGPPPAWATKKTKRGSDMPPNPLLARLNKKKPATPAAPDPVAAFREKMKAQAAKSQATPAQPEPDITYAIGDRVVLLNGVSTIKSFVGDDAAELADGRMAYLRELTAAPVNGTDQTAVEHDPLRDGMNPPDGVPADQTATLPPASRRAVRLPEGCPHAGGLCSTLRKGQATEARTWLMTKLKLAEPYGKVGAGRACATDYKADCLTLSVKLEERGPWDAPNAEGSAQPPAEGAAHSAPSCDPAPASEPTLDAGSGGPATRDAQRHAGVVKPSVVNHTVASWIGARTLVLVGTVPTESIPYTHLSDVMAPFYAAVEEEEGAPHIGLVKDFSITGYAKAAAKLRVALETGAVELPDVILASTNLDGAREALGVLTRFCAVVVRP